MSFSREESLEAIRRAQRKNPRKLEQVRERAGAALAAEKLTGKAEWDWYIQEIERRIEVKRAGLDKLFATLCDPRYMDDSGLKAVRHAAVGLSEGIRVLEDVQRIAAAAIDGGAEAIAALRDEEAETVEDSAA